MADEPPAVHAIVGDDAIEPERMDEAEAAVAAEASEAARPKPTLHPVVKWAIRLALLAMVVYVAVYRPGTLAVVVVSGLAIVYGGLWLLAWWLKRWVKRLGVKFEADMATVGALKPAGNKPAPHAENLAAMEKQFLDLGFVPAGRYVGRDDDGAYVVGMAHPRHRLYAALSVGEILKNPDMEVFAPLADGRVLSAAHQPWKYMGSLQRKPEHVYFPLLNRTPADMVEWLLRHRPEGDHPATPPEAFAVFHASFVEDEKAWKAEREAADTEAKLRARFAETSGWSAARWEKEQWRLNFIYDRHQPLAAWIEARMLSVAGEDPDGLTRALSSPPWEECGLFATPRAIVAYYVDRGESKLTRAGTVDLPCPADVYLLPDEPDDASGESPEPE